MTVLSRITVGTVGLAVLGLSGYFVAAVHTPLSSGISVLTTTVSPEAVSRSIVCAGDVVGFVGDSATITTVSSARTIVSGGDPTGDLEVEDGSTNGSVITHTGDSLLVAATDFDGVRSESVTGYLATECGDPMNDQWLIGGSTTTGRDTIITISNGGDVDARIDLEIWGSNGLVDAPGASGIIVPAKSQRSYSVAGFAPDEPSPAVHVTSNGAAVWATLHTTTVRGLVPGGLDRIGPVAGPGTSAFFPNLHVVEEDAIGEVLVDPDYADIVSVMRFLVPGDTDASVTITLDPYEDGESQVVTATIPAGATMDIPVSELAPGNWSVVVESDQPILAAARVGFHDVKSGVTDMAWASAAPAQTGTATVMVPDGGSVGLINPSAEDVVVTLAVGGIESDITIPANGSYLAEATAGALVVVTSQSPVATSVFVTTSDGIATLRGLTAPIDAANVVIVHG